MNHMSKLTEYTELILLPLYNPNVLVQMNYLYKLTYGNYRRNTLLGEAAVGGVTMGVVKNGFICNIYCKVDKTHSNTPTITINIYCHLLFALYINYK